MKKKGIYAVAAVGAALIVALAWAFLGRRDPDEAPNPRVVTMTLQGTAGAAITGYYVKFGKRIEVDGVLPMTISEEGLSTCEFLKADAGASLILEAGDGASHMRLPAGSVGIRAKLTGGWNGQQLDR